MADAIQQVRHEPNATVDDRLDMLNSIAGAMTTLEGVFPRVKHERKTAPQKFVATNCGHITDLEGKTSPFKTHEGFHRCTTLRSANVGKLVIPMQKVCGAGNIVVLDVKDPHIRNTRDGTMIDVHLFR